MDMCYTDLLDRGEKINLPMIMISHITRIANTSKDHDIGYGFLLTSVFEKLGIPLQKRVGFQLSDEVTNWKQHLDWMRFQGDKKRQCSFRTGAPTTLCLVPSEASTSSPHTFNTLLQDQIRLKGDIAEVKQELTEEKTLNAKRHKDLLSALFALTAKFASLSSST